MCGISAVYGKNAPLKSMVIILNQLERGRLGSGVAYICNNKIRIVKEPIDPVVFFDKNLNKINVNTHVAIAHNRMPSAGQVAYRNTHPFLACSEDFALAHNGHCFVTHLRNYIKQLGHNVQGETDSEILTHILEELYMEHKDMLRAIGELTVNYLLGSIVVLTKEGYLYASKSGHYPLFYALTEEEIYIGSTQKALKALLNILSIKDYEIIEVKNNEAIEIKNGYIEHYIIELPKKSNKIPYYYNYNKVNNARDWKDWLEWFYYF